MTSAKDSEDDRITFIELSNYLYISRIIIWLDLIFFSFAFLIVYLLLYQVLNPVYFLIFYFISIVLLKPEFVLIITKIFGKKRNNSQNTQSNIYSKLLKSPFIKSLLLKFTFVFPRLLFFNVLYYIFPIFIILIFSYIALLYFGYLKLQDFNNTVPIAGLIGITSGFFQYYIDRYEEKVQQKMLSKMNFITNLIIEESKYNKFKIFINGSQNFKNINNKIDSILNQPLAPQLSKILRVPGKTEIFAPSIYPEKFDQNINFQIIEAGIDEKDKQLLLDAYNSFFKNVKNNVKTKIKDNEFELKELMVFLLSNINFVLEAMPAFLQISSALEENKKTETYIEFLSDASLDIMNEVLTEYALEG